MKNIFFIISFVACILTIISCKNNVSLKEIQYYGSTEKSVAEQCIENLLTREKILTNRSIATPNTELSILSNIKILNDEDNLVSYEDLTDEEKAYIAESWYKEEVAQLEKKISADKDLEAMLKIENEAFRRSIETMTTSRNILKTTPEGFMEKYYKELTQLTKDNSVKNRATAKTGNVKDAVINQVSAKRLFTSWQRGNILICKDTNSSSGSAYLGHASLVDREWNNEFYSNPTAWASYTSSPVDKSAQWAGKIDGVQPEPIGYWIGEGTACAQAVSVLKVRNRIYSKGWKYSETTYDQRDKAVKKSI